MFLSGLVLGVLATSHVWIVASRVLREAALADYQLEQLIRGSAAPAHLDSDSYRELEVALERLRVATQRGDANRRTARGGERRPSDM